MSFTFLNQLPTPEEIKRDYPLTPELAELKKQRDAMISDVITGKDSRFLVIIGPCSADNEDSVCDYVSRLTKIVFTQTSLVQQVKVTRVSHPSQTRKKHRIWWKVSSQCVKCTSVRLLRVVLPVQTKCFTLRTGDM